MIRIKELCLQSSNYCCISFLKSLKILRFRFKEKPASKIPKKHKATPLDYTIVKLHIDTIVKLHIV